MILDEQVPTADPGELVAQLEPLLYCVLKRYKRQLKKRPAVDEDDLLQAGRIAIYTAQKTYDPAGGVSFGSYAFNPIRSAMRRVLGYKTDGTLPPVLESLDEPLTGDEDCDTSRLDMVPDPSVLPFDEPLIAEENRQETAVEVRAALDRLKSDRQRDILTRIHFDGQERKTIAADLSVSVSGMCQQEQAAYRKLRADKRLRQFAEDIIPFVHIGVNRFRSTWVSSVEWSVLWREEHLAQHTRETAMEGKTDDFG